MDTVRFFATDIQPNPVEVDYWIDLSDNPYGAIIKYWDGTEWSRLAESGGNPELVNYYTKVQVNALLNGKASVESVESKVDDEEAKDVVKGIQFRTSLPDQVQMTLLKYDDTTVAISLPIASDYTSGVITSEQYKNLAKQVDISQLYQDLYESTSRVLASIEDVKQKYQRKLKAGKNIRISEDNVISTIANIEIDWGSITDKPLFSDVATSGDYNDLINKLTPGNGIKISDSNVISSDVTISNIDDLQTKLNNEITRATTAEKVLDAKVDTKANKDDVYTKKQVDDKLVGAYKVKGSSTFEDLPSSNTVGDIYNITNDFTLNGEPYMAGTNIVWTEDGWDPLSGSFDTTAIEQSIQNVASDLDEEIANRLLLDNRVQVAEGKLNVINGDSNTPGSISKALKDANTYTDNSVASERSRAQAAEKVNADNISKNTQSITNNAAAIATNASNIATNTSTIYENSQDIEANAQAILKEISDRKKAVTDAIDKEVTDRNNAIAVETNRAMAVESKLTDDIAAEVTNRNTAISNAVKVEKDRAEEAESTIASNLSAEITRAKAAEKANTDLINKEVTDRQNAITTEVTNRNAAIDVEKQRAMTAESALDTKITNHVNSTNTALNTKADKSTTYTKTEVDGKISTLTNGKQDKLTAGEGIKIENNTISSTIDTTLYKVVSELPTTDIQENKIYLIHTTSSINNNVYTEYIYVNGKWEILGDFNYDEQIDFSTFLTKVEAASTYQPKGNYALKSEIPNISGKADKTYVDSQINTVNTEVAKKANKADLATVATSGSYNDLTNKLKAGSGLTITSDNTLNVNVDLTEVTNSIDAVDSKIDAEVTRAKAAEATKVDKVTGKGLSTNDYTTAEKNKLANLGNHISGIDTAGTTTGSSYHVLKYTEKNVSTGSTINHDIYIRAATPTSAGVMTSSDRNKLDGIAEGANKTIVDSALSSTSTNPVQNKVVNSALQNKSDIQPIKLTNEDLNNITNVGQYFAEGYNSVTNKPTALNEATSFALRVYKTAASYITQEFISGSASTNSKHIRTFNGTSWGQWESVASSFTNTPVSGQIVVADGIDGKVKSSGYTISKSVPADAKFTDTTYTFANGTDGSFTVTPTGGTAQKVSIGKPAEATKADSANTALRISNTFNEENVKKNILMASSMSDNFAINVGNTGNDKLYVEMATGDNGDEPIYVRQYAGATIKNSATLLDSSGNTLFPNTVTANKFIGQLQGTADNASKVGLYYSYNNMVSEFTDSRYHCSITDTTNSTWYVKLQCTIAYERARVPVILNSSYDNNMCYTIVYLEGLSNFSFDSTTYNGNNVQYIGHTNESGKVTLYLQMEQSANAVLEADSTRPIELTKISSIPDSVIMTHTGIKWYNNDTIGSKYVVASVAFRGSLQGNSDTATKLATARNIAITGDITGNANFDGSSNININTSLGTLAKTINSSKTSGTWLAANTGNVIINSTLSSGFNMLCKFSSRNGYFIMGVYDQSFMIYYTDKSVVDAGTNAFTRAAKLLDESGGASFAGVVHASSFSGNSTSSTKLQTPRSINGTNFDGSANITTANWGTARNITIGKTAKSVNGSANVSWSASEIASNATTTADGWMSKEDKQAISNISGDFYGKEQVTVQLKKGSTNFAGNVTIKNKDTNEVIATSATGNVTARIVYGVKYVISVPNVDGYYYDQVLEYTASQSVRNVDVVYNVLVINTITINMDITDPATMISGDVNGSVIQNIRNNTHRYAAKYTAQGTVTICQLDDSNSNLFHSGESSNTSSIDRFVRIPRFYYNVDNTDKNIQKISFSMNKPNNSTWQEWDGNDLIGCYEATVSANKLYSYTGMSSTGDTSYTQFREFARSRGTGYRLVTWQQHCMVAILFYAIYGHTNCQAKIGSSTSSYTKQTGQTDSIGMTDTVAGGNGDSNSINFLGLENWWGNKYEFMDNIRFNYNSEMTKPNFSIQEYDGTWRHVKLGGFMSGGWKYPRRLIIGQKLDLFMEDDTNNYGSETTGFCDGQYYALNNTNAVVLRSCNFSYADGGVACLYTVDSDSYTYAGYGSRLAFRGNIIEEKNVQTFLSL